jgi:hypothetical protein
MSKKFSDLVEGVKALTTAEKEELQDLIEKYLIEERRHDIHDNYVQSKRELDSGKLEFSSNTGKLKRMLSK